MPKSLCLGNGSTLILFDRYSHVRDLYFPYVGLENHVGGHNSHRIGLYTDNKICWLDEQSWDISNNLDGESMTGITNAINSGLNLKLRIEDSVFNENNIFIRKITIGNTLPTEKKIKIFFDQKFELYESNKGNTAYYDPDRNVIIHYKGRRVFLISTLCDHHGFDDYAVGRFGTPGKGGTHIDAEDGILSKNSIEHGLVDSVIGNSLIIGANTSKTMYYWMTIGKSIHEVCHLHSYILRRSPQYIMHTTQDYWHAWVNKQDKCLCVLSDEAKSLYKKSLLVIRAHIDNNGAVIAAGDSDFLEHGKDTYAYTWPRDGAYIISSLLDVKETTPAERFFNFCEEVITQDGYLMHKYRPDRSLGSSWHPWTVNNERTLPIQEDETAHVLVVLWQYYEQTKNLELIEKLYNSLIKIAAEFLMQFTDNLTGLPRPSYDLWEERLQVTTYTSSSVYAGLLAGAKFATVLGKTKKALSLDLAAEKMKNAILKYLYDDKIGYFYRGFSNKNGELYIDKTVDSSSVYGILSFNVLAPTDMRLKSAIKYTEEKLGIKTDIGGIARYEGDIYYRSNPNLPGNPWIITTLWLAQYYIRSAANAEDLDKAIKLIEWATANASPSGMLPEQIEPYSGNHLSVSPLTWSHAEYVRTINAYVDKSETIGICSRRRSVSGRSE